MAHSFAFETTGNRPRLIVQKNPFLPGFLALAVILSTFYFLNLVIIQGTGDEAKPLAVNLSRVGGERRLPGMSPPALLSHSTLTNDPAMIPAAILPANWWNTAYRFRVPIQINANGYPRDNKPTEMMVNFTQLLTTLGKNGVFDPNSIRVLEVNAQGQVVEGPIDFQFDPATGYNASTNAAGTVVFLLKGTTVATATRYYHLYFDTTSNGPFTPLVVPPQITVTDNISHEGQLSFKIQTQNATYYYHKQGAGFASMEDQQGIDWLGYHPTGGSAGNFRGIPNMGVWAHPGYTNSTSSLVGQGPLKAIISSETTDSKWGLTWEMYPAYAKMTLLKRDTAQNYWFLYEGTPNGQLDTVNPGADYVVRSTGTKTNVSTSWEGDIPTPEWVYFGDDDVSRAIFVAHHTDDTAVDQFYQMEGNMTVFGFGRAAACCTKYLTQVPNLFTIGFAESSASASQTINAAYRDLVVSLGQPEALNREPVLNPIGPKVVVAGNTLTFTVTASDPDGTIPGLSVQNLPGGATFNDNGNGMGFFTWPATLTDVGDRAATFIASDGILTDSETITLTVQPSTSPSNERIFLPLILK